MFCTPAGSTDSCAVASPSLDWLPDAIAVGRGGAWRGQAAWAVVEHGHGREGMLRDWARGPLITAVTCLVWLFPIS